MSPKIFSKKDTIIYLTQYKMWARDLSSKDKQVHEIPWDGEDLKPALEELSASVTKDNTKIIIGTDISYVGVLLVDTKEVGDEVIFSKIKTQIPFEVHEDTVDWKIVKKDKLKTLIQIFAIKNKYLDFISQAFHAHSYDVRSLLPAAVLVARSQYKERAPYILLHKGYEEFAAVAESGAVFCVNSLEDGITDELQNVFKTCAEEFSLAISKVITTDQRYFTSFGEGWEKKLVEVNLLEHNSVGISKISFTKRRLLYSIIAVLLIVAVAYVGSLSRTTPSVVPSPIPTLEPTPKPTPDISADLTGLSFLVLNGTGVPGSAGEVSDLFRDKVTEIDTGNAENYEYEDTIVSIAEGLEENVYTTVASLLDGYSVTRGETLPDDEVDVQIIVGTK